MLKNYIAVLRFSPVKAISTSIWLLFYLVFLIEAVDSKPLELQGSILSIANFAASSALIPVWYPQLSL